MGANKLSFFAPFPIRPTPQSTRFQNRQNFSSISNKSRVSLTHPPASSPSLFTTADRNSKTSQNPNPQIPKCLTTIEPNQSSTFPIPNPKMIYSSLHKLLRHHSQSAAKLISHFHNPATSSPNPFLLTRLAKSLDQIPVPNHPQTDSPNPTRSSSGQQVYQPFSFGLFLNPNPIPPNIRVEEMPPDEDDDSRVIRADSVKKKRKKKMNKHKLRKLRRRLRRKT